MKDTNEDLLDLDWDKAKTFYYVAKSGSMGEAARLLKLKAPSISRQISILEDSLKDKLFIRFTKGVKLTKFGEEFFKLVERTFLDFKRFHINHDDNTNTKPIRIITTNAMAAYIFNDLIIKYIALNPHLKIVLIGEDKSTDLIANNIDLAIYPLDPSISNPDFVKNVTNTYIFSLEKKLFASPQYLEKYGEPLTVEELKNHRIISHTSLEPHPFSNINWILSLGMADNQFHESFYSSNSVECLISLAKAGQGIIGSYEEYSAIKNSQLKQILPSVKDEPIKQYIIMPKVLKNRIEIQKLKNFLIEELEYDLKSSY